MDMDSQINVVQSIQQKRKLNVEIDYKFYTPQFIKTNGK